MGFSTLFIHSNVSFLKLMWKIGANTDTWEGAAFGRGFIILIFLAKTKNSDSTFKMAYRVFHSILSAPQAGEAINLKVLGRRNR